MFLLFLSVLFYNCEILYYLYDHLQHFFNTEKDYIKLLKAVQFDLQIQSYLCGCRGFSLINKFVTGPLWRFLESGIYIPDLNEHYQRMCSLFFNVIFFENIEISKESVYNFLLLPSDILHKPIKQFSDIIFEILCIVTRRMLNDHRKDGKYANPCEDYKKRLSV